MTAGCASSEYKLLREIEVGYGPEDFVLLENGVDPQVITGCSHTWKTLLHRQETSTNGKIYTVRINDSRLKGRELRLHDREDASFHPLGMFALTEEDGNQYVYVVNNRFRDDSSPPACIEKYRVKNGELYFVAAFDDESPGKYLPRPNGLAASHDGHIYVSNFNDGLFPKNRTPHFDDLKSPEARKVSNIVHISPPGSWSVVCKLRGANGLEISPNGKTLFVTSFSGKKVFGIDREPVSGKLIVPSVREWSTKEVYPDNLALDKSCNRLTIGCHKSVTGSLLRMFFWKDFPAPSAVYEIDLENRDAQEAQLIFEPEGFNCCSTARRIGGDRFIISQVAGNRLQIYQKIKE